MYIEGPYKGHYLGGKSSKIKISKMFLVLKINFLRNFFYLCLVNLQLYSPKFCYPQKVFDLLKKKSIVQKIEKYSFNCFETPGKLII